MIAKFLLRRLPESSEQDGLSYALEAARVARHARPHDWARLRGELVSAAERPDSGAPARAEARHSRRGLSGFPEPSLG